MDRWLTRLANVLIVIVGVVVLQNLWSSQSRSSLVPGEFKKGQKIDASKLGLTKPALLLVTRSSCRYCTADMPFYSSLDGGRIIALAAGESVETNSQYLASHNVRPAKVIAVDDIGIGIIGTPTLILVDAKGVVQQAWRGQLDEPRRREVKKKIEEL